MRRLMWFTIGFSAACAGALFLLSKDVIWLCACCFAAAAILLSLKNPGLFRKIAAVAVYGCACGLIWVGVFQGYYIENIASLDGDVQNVTVTATDYTETTDRGTVRVKGSMLWNGKRYNAYAYLLEDASLAPGDMVTASFRLQATVSDDWYYPGIGIFLLAYQESAGSVVHGETLSISQKAAVLSNWIQNRLSCYFTKSEFAFVKAVLLGQTAGIDYAMDTGLKISGIRHIVAVSGLHISVLIGFLHILTLKRPWFTALLGFPVLAVFAAMAGFTPSVSRACIMAVLIILGLCIDREYDGITALAVSVLIMLLINPMVVASVSLQLSVASVTGIFLFCSPIYEKLITKWNTSSKYLDAIGKWIVSSVSVTLSAMVFTVPLSAVYFGSISLIGILTNLLTLWAVGCIFCGIVVVCAVSLFWHGGAAALAGVVSWLIQYVLCCADLLSRFPVAAVYTDSVYIVAWVVFCYCLIGLFLLHKQRPAKEYILCAALSLMIALYCSWAEPQYNELRMQVLDVGQGQSIVIHTEGRTFLVDCGGDSDETTADIVAQNLLSQGIRRLDGIIITHHDTDHAGALPYLLTRIDTDYLIAPFTQEEVTLPLIDGKTIRAKEDMKISLESGLIHIFASGYWQEGNENSLCVLFEKENCAILITGDRSSLGEKLLLKKTRLPKVDVLVAGHHGAKDSTCVELLDAVQPDIVMISSGEGNFYGHPHEETLRRLNDYGCEVYRTDKNGTLEFRR